MKVIGKILSGTSQSRTLFSVNLEYEKELAVMEFVQTRNVRGETVIGLIESLKDINTFLDEVIGTSFNLLSSYEGRVTKLMKEKSHNIIASMRILGVIKEEGNGLYLSANRHAIKPGEDVYFVPDEILEKIFNADDSSGIFIGSLLNREKIKVMLDANKLLQRHFAILAVTGAGKSNTVAVLLEELAKKNATVIVIDPHGDYSKDRFAFSDSSLNKKLVYPKLEISLERVHPEVFLDILEFHPNADVQRNKVAIALEMVKKEIKKLETPPTKQGLGMERLTALLKRIAEKGEDNEELVYSEKICNVDITIPLADDLDKNQRAAIRRKLFELRKYEKYFVTTKDRDIVDNLKPNKINIITLTRLTLTQQSAILTHLLSNILEERIKYMINKDENVPEVVKTPVLILLEEAHLYASSQTDSILNSLLSRISREGRKFGISLGIVSQRPKKLNEDVLSQCNTKIILKLVEPNDKKYVQNASEQLSEELMQDLSGLNIGEAIIVGQAVKIPVAVKIRKFSGKYGGEDINFVDEWGNYTPSQERKDLGEILRGLLEQ